MAEYTITIRDEEAGVSVGIKGPAGVDSPASGLAQSLVGVAPRLLAKIAEIATSKCDCDQCKAARELKDTQPTLH